MQLTSVAIFGASGYSGIELAKLCATHPALEVKLLTSDRWVGEDAAVRLGSLAGLTFVGHDDGLARAKSCAVAFLATPAEVSLKLAPKLIAQGVKVIDLSGAFRLKDARLYPKYYGFEHTEPALLAEAVYGLPELFRKDVGKARLVANPGCYPTAAALSLTPLLQAGLVQQTGVVINSASGVSGAGRKASEEYTFMEIDDDVRAYKVLKHQHTPEITQTMGSVAGAKVELVFTPHLLPLKRGILNTTVATLKAGTTEAQVKAAYQEAFAAEPLVQLLPSADAVRLAHAAHTPRCLVGVSVDGDKVVAISAIDNLLKGAASQAMQNLNLMIGQPETSGLVPRASK
jgi:N-acetyl-gamma-glutamyl-phosphate reductase